MLEAGDERLLRAVQTLLAQKGIASPAEIAERIAMTDAASPAQGARMVARAWLDREYRALLLADGTRAAEALGIPMRGAPPLGVLENTDDLHHLVVCTLCSCYPRAVLGYPPFWFKSAAYRARAVRDPRGLLAEFGTMLADTVRVRVVDSTADYRWMVLPLRPAGTEGWDEARLAAIVREGDMIGVTPGRALIRTLAALGLLLLGAAAAHAASPPAVEGTRFMVVSSHRLASEAGAAVLRAGGNAVDAAVAMGYALAVVDPCCGNIGGGGFMTLHLADGRDIFVNFRETAPAAATPGMFLDADGKVAPGASLFGWRAVAVPGTVLGLDTALLHYGTMPRARVMAAAIRLAREGFAVAHSDTDLMERMAGRLRADPEAARIFLRPDGTTLQNGDILVQPALADTLADIAARGPDAFYRGRIPAAIEAAARAGGGIITAADFAGYTVTESPPLACTYHGWRFLSAAPPSSGGVTLCEILDILDGYDLRKLGFHSAETVHVMVEAMRQAFLDRNADLGDPAFVHNPLDRLLSQPYAAALRAEIGPRATPSRELTPATPPHEHAETTHFSVLDATGNAVAVTYTINGAFGAGVMAPGTGFLLNDEMDDFTVKSGTANMFGLVQGEANAIAPGKRPLSSMAPTIVLRDRHVALVLGSPGGSRIITTVLETALNVIEFGLAPQEAVDAARFHHQWLPDEIFVEPLALSPDTEAVLRGMGYAISKQTPWGAAELIAVGGTLTEAASPSSGNDAAVSTRLRPGRLYGASDPRRPAGAAIGE